MVVRDEHIHAQLPSVFTLLHGRDPAVHTDEQAHALLPESIQRAAVEAVALFVPVGDIGIAGQPFTAQIVRHQTGGGDAVHIVVAIDGDRLSPGDGLTHAGTGHVHPQHLQRIVQQLRPALQQGLGLPGIGHAPQR